jgi:protein arginine kinase activator
MHRGLRHVGKRPAGFEGDPYAEGLLEEARERLEEAIKNEHYEEAARLRDEISQLEEESREKTSVSSEGGDAA